ncbi:MAG: hypothetical protein H2045_02135 [Rhizobiales bacterium]|nr:hypothetical protein [Hyphomicrobiales bacterium]
MSQVLRRGIVRLELTTKITLGILALASGVYTYIGVRGLLQGTEASIFFGAVIYATAVSVAIYAFWSYLIQFAPHIRDAGTRRVMFFSMLIGCGMIMAMSSWLNAAALAGGAALEQHLANTTEDYQVRLNKAHNNALSAQSLLPDIELAVDRFKRLADEERASGALTGTSGSGTVVQLLQQMSSQLDGLAEEVRGARTVTDSLYEQGGSRLGQMRKIVSSFGPIEDRSIAFAEEAVALAGVITALEQTSIAPSVKRAADDLASTFVAPEADGGTSGNAELATRQRAVVSRVEKAIAAQSVALSKAADEILARETLQPLRFKPLSSAEAVLLYAKDFLPSWAGAISIDLLPGVLILILTGVQASIRREEGHDLEENQMTVGEMSRALRLYDNLPAALARHFDRPDQADGQGERPLFSPGAVPLVAVADDGIVNHDKTIQPGVTKLTGLKPRPVENPVRDPGRDGNG